MANATSVDEWKVSSLLYGSGRIKESVAVGGFVEGHEICDMRCVMWDFFADGCFKVLYAAFVLRNFYVGS